MPTSAREVHVEARAFDPLKAAEAMMRSVKLDGIEGMPLKAEFVVTDTRITEARQLLKIADSNGLLHFDTDQRVGALARALDIVLDLLEEAKRGSHERQPYADR